MPYLVPCPAASSHTVITLEERSGDRHSGLSTMRLLMNNFRIRMGAKARLPEIKVWVGSGASAENRMNLWDSRSQCFVKRR